jgi:hypothetical protein
MMYWPSTYTSHQADKKKWLSACAFAHGTQLA